MTENNHAKNSSIRRWIVLSFTVILLISFAVSAVANYREAYIGAMDQTGALAEIFSHIVEQLSIHQWDLDRPGLTVESEDYVNAHRTFRSLCRLFQIDDAYIYRITDPDVPSRYYYLYAADDEARDRECLQSAALQTVPGEKLLTGEKKLTQGDGTGQDPIMHSVYPDRIVWTAPCHDREGRICALIGTEYDIKRVRHRIVHNFLVDIIPFSLSLLAGMLMLLFLVQRRIVRPVSALSERMKLFAKNSRIKPEPVSIPFRDEIGEIEKSFEKMTEDISSYINNIEKLTEERTEYNVQMQLARRIQYGMVPERTDLNEGAVHINAVTVPAKAVGGDFYDCFRQDENSICIVLGDVSGKGISAALYMAMIKTVLREKLMLGMSPADALRQTNRELCAQNPEGLFVTVFAAVLNTSSGELLFANAGHTCPLLIGRSVEPLKMEYGMALGLFDDAVLQDETALLPAGEGLVLYTDGLTEATNPQRELYGMQRLMDTLERIPMSPDPTEEILLGIRQDVDAFRDGCEPFDDMAILVVFRRSDGNCTAKL